MTKINLDDLEAKAKAATPWDAYDHGKASKEWHANKENNANYCRVMNPQTALALIRVVRAAISVSQHHAGKSIDELKEALKEIE